MRKQNGLIKMTILLYCSAIVMPIIPMFKYAQPQQTSLIERKKAGEEARTQTLKSQRKKQCYDLMMILDDFGEETVDGISKAMTRELIIALSQKKFPIVVSSNIAENVYFFKSRHNADMLQLTKSFEHPVPLLQSLNITNEDWYLYAHKKSDIMLFIPKNYIMQFADISKENDIINQMNRCGFDITHLEQIKQQGDSFFSSLVPLLSIKKQGRISMVEAIKSMFVIPNQPNQPTWNVYLTGHGAISKMAGLKMADFFRLILDCFKKINCSFLYYNSCYSGGLNQNVFKDVLSQIHVNFMIAGQGINEETTVGHSTGLLTNFSKITNFFKITEAIFGNSIKAAENIDLHEAWEKDPIASIVSTVIDKDELDFSQPFVYFPAAGVFNALIVDKSVKIITESIAKAYEFENKPMDFTDPAIDIVIMYPEYISVPIKIKANVAIACPNRQNKQPKPEIEPSIHIFENITYNDELSSMIPNFISFNKKIGITVFAIKKLQCFDYPNSGLGNDYDDLISINNMMMYHLFDGIRNHVLVIFDFNGKIYFLEAGFQLEFPFTFSTLLFEAFKNKSAQEREQFVKKRQEREQFTQGRKKVYPDDLLYWPFFPQIRDYLKSKNLLLAENRKRTLADIINIFQSTIDTTTRVQEPGSLKRVLLQKQLHMLGQQVDDPAVSYTAYLEKLKKVAGELLTMAEKDENVSVESSLALIKLNDLIDEEYLKAQQSETDPESWPTFFATKIQQSFDTLMHYPRKVTAALANKVIEAIKKQLLYIEEYKKSVDQKHERSADIEAFRRKQRGWNKDDRW